MHSVIKYMEAIKGNAEKEHELLALVCGGLHKLKAHDEDEYRHLLGKIHCIAYGPHFDECLAKKAVAEMRNVDGTAGEHWTMEQTDAIAGQYSIHHKCDWYYVMNMLYSDFAKVLGSDANTYAKMAVAYINDPDAGEGKAFKLYLAGE